MTVWWCLAEIRYALFFEVSYLRGRVERRILASSHFLFLEKELSLNPVGFGIMAGRPERQNVALFQ